MRVDRLPGSGVNDPRASHELTPTKAQEQTRVRHSSFSLVVLQWCSYSPRRL